MGAALRRTATALAVAVTFGAAPSPGWAAPGEAGKYLAEAVRDKGLPCREAESAKPDPSATSADEAGVDPRLQRRALPGQVHGRRVGRGRAPALIARAGR